MIKTVIIEQRQCDYCDKDAYEWTVCLGCGKDICSPLSGDVRPHAIRYAHSVNFSGSGDGYYCTPCDVRLSESKSDPLHRAYVAIRAFRDEGEQVYTERKRQGESIDAEVVRLRTERGLR